MGELAQKIRAKYPGSYDALPDSELEAKITAKYPGVYDHLTSEWRTGTGAKAGATQADFLRDEGTTGTKLRQSFKDTPAMDYVKEPARFAAETALMPLNALGRGLKSVASTVQGGGEAIRTGSIDAGLQRYQQKQAEFQPVQSPMAPSAMGNMIAAGAQKGINKLSDLTGRPDIVEPVAQGAMDIGALAGLKAATPALSAGVRAGGRGLVDLAGGTAAKIGITPEKMYASSLKQSTVIPMEQRAANVKAGLEGGYVPNKKGLNRLYNDINEINGQIGAVIEEAATRGKQADATPFINEIKAIDTAIAGEQTRAVVQAQNKAIQQHMIRNEGGHWMQKTNIPDASYFANLRKAYDALPPEKQIQGGLPSPETVSSPVIDNFIAKKTQLQKAVEESAPTGKTIKVDDILTRLEDVKQRAIDSFGDNNPALRSIKGFEKSLKNHPSVVNGEIPIDIAQQMKTNTYKQLKNAYGELKGFEVEAKKAMARGAKEEIVAQIPELAALNAKDSTLINLEKVLFKAVNRIENRDMMGIGVPIKALAGGQAGVKGMFIGTLLGLIDTPTIKANLAIAMHKARGKSVPKTEINTLVQKMQAGLLARQTQGEQP